MDLQLQVDEPLASQVCAVLRAALAFAKAGSQLKGPLARGARPRNPERLRLRPLQAKTLPSRWRSTSKPTGRVATSKAAQKRPPPKGAPGWPGLGGQAPLAGAWLRRSGKRAKGLPAASQTPKKVGRWLRCRAVDLRCQ